MKRIMATALVAGVLVFTSVLPAAAAGGGKGYGGPQKCNVWCIFPGQIAGCC